MRMVHQYFRLKRSGNGLPRSRFRGRAIPLCGVNQCDDQALERSPGLLKSELYLILLDAYKWGMWMNKMSLEAAACGDPEYLAKGKQLSGDILDRVLKAADDTRIMLPDWSDFIKDNVLSRLEPEEEAS